MMKKRLPVLVVSLAAWVSAHASDSADLNDYVVEATEWMAANVAKRGYELRSTYTDVVPYGAEKLSPSNHGKTMCVAAVLETAVRAVNLYMSRMHDDSPTQKLGIRDWNGTRYLDVRPHLFQFKEVSSNGPGDAFTRLGIGESVAFDSLKPGDMLAFSRRQGSGHAVVFLRYINKKKELTSSYSDEVIGFRYFSAQGKDRPDAGVGYRNAYFPVRKECNQYVRGDAISDCGIFDKGRFKPNGGRLWHPSRWKVDEARKKLKDDYLLSLRSKNPELTSRSVEVLSELYFEKELPEVYSWEDER